MTPTLSITQKNLNSFISKICRDIVISNWRPDYIVGITRGGLIPAVMISHYLNVPCYTLGVSLRDNEHGCETNCWMSEDAFGYNSDTRTSSNNNKKNILIVDDINDSGATINWIKNDWQSTCLPNSNEWDKIWGDSVRYAVIVDKLSSKAEVPVSYHGLELDNDIWITFPYEEWWREQ